MSWRSGGSEWITTVSAHGGFGKWAWDVALEPADVPDALEKRDARA